MPLLIAAHKGHLRAVQISLDRGTDIGARATDGATKLLLNRRGIRNQSKGHRYLAPLFMATGGGDVPTVRLFPKEELARELPPGY